MYLIYKNEQEIEMNVKKKNKVYFQLNSKDNAINAFRYKKIQFQTTAI